MAQAKRLNNTKHLQGALGDVRRTNHFRLFIEKVMDDKNDLDLIVQQAFLPQVSVGVLELRHGNDSKKLAGVATWNGGTITVLDTLKPNELDALLDWRDAVVNFDEDVGTYIGYADDFSVEVSGNSTSVVVTGYKRQGTLVEYTSNGKLVRQWTLNGLWPSEINLGDFDATRGDLRTISVTLQVDPSPLKPTYKAEFVPE